jgi:hypothetical protein
MVNLFRTQQSKLTQSGLRVRTAIRVGYGGGGSSNWGWSGGGSYIPMPSIPAAPYLPQGGGCTVPQKGYSDGFTKGFGDSPRR